MQTVSTENNKRRSPKRKAWANVRTPSTDDKKIWPPRIPANRSKEAPLGAGRREFENRMNRDWSAANGIMTQREATVRLSLRSQSTTAATGINKIPSAPSTNTNDRTP